MAGRIQVSIITLLLLISLIDIGSAWAGTLVSYSFDDNNLATGPDTFAVFQHAKGTVGLSRAFRYSGYSSIEIRDVAKDGDFPELQGYFTPRDRGILYAHFTFLTTDPSQEFNIALAGPKWFSLQKDGIAFWLKAEDGFLRHVSDSIPKKLFPLSPFVWYLVDVSYDIGAGIYDLSIHEEAKPQPLLSLRDQKNAPNQPGSIVDKFSFIGDAGTDTSNVVYYVDDVMVGTDEAITQHPFVAPGRRKLFVNSYQDARKLAAQNPHTIPAVALADFGISAHEALALQQQDAMKLVADLVNGRSVAPSLFQGLSIANIRLLQAIDSWNAGRSRLEKGEAEEALSCFDAAVEKVPAGKIYDLYAVLALTALKRWPEVDLRLGEIYATWQGDLRFGVVLALVGMARQNLDEAEQWLQKSVEQIPDKINAESVRQIWNGPITPEVIKTVKRQFPEQWHDLILEPLVAEQYFYVLLWKDRLAEAEQYASRMINRFKTLQLDPAQWQEHAGDAAFLAGNTVGALGWYQAAMEKRKVTSVLLKLSDVYFQLGDLERERIYREMIYGSLLTQN